MDSIDDQPSDDSDHSSSDRGRQVPRKYAKTISYDTNSVHVHTRQRF